MSNKSSFEHYPVMLNEVVDNLNINSDGVYLDCTLGGGGHSQEVFSHLSEKGRLFCIDRDLDAIENALDKFSGNSNINIYHSNFSDVVRVLGEQFVSKLDGIIMDLGVSSHQIDVEERGFAYIKNARLDMRMDQHQKVSAYDVVNSYSQDELKNIFRKYGDESLASKIAFFICDNRKIKKIETSFELNEIIQRAAGKGKRGMTALKRIYQAIRIEVNAEIKELELFLEKLDRITNPGARVCVITFHSIEDRIVKHTFKDLIDPCTCPREFPVCICNKKPLFKFVSRKPIYPSKDELSENSRSKSAKLRVIERL